MDKNEFLNEIKKYNDSVKYLSKALNSSNIVGMYAEKIVCELLNLTPTPNSCKDFDATAIDGDKYQIKSRWIKKNLQNKGQYEFGGIKKYMDGYHFQYLILVLFNDDLLKQEIYQINANNINKILEIGKGKKFAYVKDDKVIFKANSNFINEVNNNTLIKKINNVLN